MLLPIVIDAAAIGDGSSDEARLEREDVLDRLLEHGVPYFRAADTKETADRLRSLPTSERKRWTEGLRFFGHRTVEASGILPSDLKPIFRQDDALVVLATASADLTMAQVGLEPPVAVAPRTKTEYAAASHIRRCASIQLREGWADKDIWPNESLDQVANQRFAPLFRSCRQLSIVDRYAFKSLVTKGGRSGLSWLLGLLATTSKRPCKVSLYSEYIKADGDRNLAERRDRAIDGLPGRCAGIDGELNLYLGDGGTYSAYAHDRYLRIDDSRVITIGNGCDAFEEGRVRQHCSFTYQVLKRSDQHTDFRELEDQLQRGTSVPVVTTALGSGFE